MQYGKIFRRSKMNKDELLKAFGDLNGEAIENIDCNDCNGCNNCNNCNNCDYCDYCNDCNDCNNCYRCYNCYNCYNCILCKSLSNKRKGYWLLNKEVTKAEWMKAKKELEK
jgi:RecJ-like exonuclease